LRAVVQRVARASVRICQERTAEILRGVLVLVGVGVQDTEQDARWLADKVRALRIFPDDDGVMNLSVEEAGGAVLAVSQFTLLGDVRRGRRPSYIAAAPPERAEPLYHAFCDTLRTAGLQVAEGRFQAMMEVELVNDGPVTILLDSKKSF
jgi:D-tyrosyl-tRNA(Tyr) deacylase